MSKKNTGDETPDAKRAFAEHAATDAKQQKQRDDDFSDLKAADATAQLAEAKQRDDHLAALAAVAKPFLSRSALLEAGACGPGLEFFEARVDANNQTDGHHWTEEEARHSYTKSPRFLRFLETRGLVPMLEVEGLPSVSERRQAAHDARSAQRAARERIAGFVPRG